MYTFLFTDIEGSTEHWEQHPQAMSAALAFHDAVMAQTVTAHHGKIFKTLGDGVCAVFDVAPDALQAALRVQFLLYEASRRSTAPLLPLSVRMALYSGPAEERANDYFGTSLNRASRLMNAAHGGQILVSASTKALLPASIELRDLGTHRLRDVSEPEHIYQAVSPNVPLNTRPLRSLKPRPTNLPAPLTSFVGRERNIAEVASLLRQPHVRLLTLLGPGGIGKTRLSIQIGGDLLDEYDDGVFFVSLAPLNQPDAVRKAIAQALHLQEEVSTDPLDAIKAFLQSRQLLLILDNFEHILDVAPLVNELLVAAARVKILTTSREPLDVYGEHTYPVPPLDLPDTTDEARLMASSAARLFIERVRASQPEFATRGAEARDVVAICRQLDGVPLALELAAARVRDLSLSQVAEGLAHRLTLLSKGPRDAPSRQQTMRGAIEWSYDLLSPDERRAFASLAIFEGQFFAESARTVIDFPDLESLRQKSLLQQSNEGVLSMYGVLREYALERLPDFVEPMVLRQRHAVYYCNWLVAAEPHLNGRGQIEWFSRLSVEQYNLQAALAWFAQTLDFENAGRMVGILWRYWATQSHLNEGWAWANRVLDHADQLSTLVHAKVTQGAGRLALLRYDYEAAAALQETSLTLFESINNQPNRAAVLLSLGEIRYELGDHMQAQQHLEDSLRIFRRLNDSAGIGRSLNVIGRILLQTGDFIKAEPLLTESLALARQHGSYEAIALALYDLAGLMRINLKHQEAKELYEESLGLYRELNLDVGIGTILYNLGFTLHRLGQDALAMQHFVEALTILRNLDEPVAIAECMIGFSGAFMRAQRGHLCVQTLSAANALLATFNAEGEVDYVNKAEYDRIYAAIPLHEPRWHAEWATGQSIPLEELIAEILRDA